MVGRRKNREYEKYWPSMAGDGGQAEEWRVSAFHGVEENRFWVCWRRAEETRNWIRTLCFRSILILCFLFEHGHAYLFIP